MSTKRFPAIMPIEKPSDRPLSAGTAPDYGIEEGTERLGPERSGYIAAKAQHKRGLPKTLVICMFAPVVRNLKLNSCLRLPVLNTS